MTVITLGYLLRSNYFIQLNKEVFGRVERDIQQKMIQLQDAQNSISSIDDVRKEKVIREELETLLNREEVLWAQKARFD